MDDNPYAPPKVALGEFVAAGPLPGWSPSRLRLLAALSLASALGSLWLLLLTLLESSQPELPDTAAADWLGLALVLLGNYLLLCLKDFAQARFAARGLAWPVWLMVISGLLLEGLDLSLGKQLLQGLDGRSLAYFALLVVYGLATLWLGLSLLRVENVYPAFRLLAWLDIAGGAMLASVLLMLLAIVPLLGSSLALMWVFLRAAREQRVCLKSPASAPTPD